MTDTMARTNRLRAFSALPRSAAQPRRCRSTFQPQSAPERTRNGRPRDRSIQARSLCRQGHRRLRIGLHRPDGQPGQQARPVQGDGLRRPAQRQGGRAARRLRRALRARVAQLAGRERVPGLPRGERHLRAHARTGDGAGRRGEPGLHPAGVAPAGRAVGRRAEGARGISHRARRVVGRARCAAWRAAWPRSSATATVPTSCRTGCPRSTAWSSNCRPASRWPTSAAATGTRRG